MGHRYGTTVDSADVDVLVARTIGQRPLPTSALGSTDVVMVQLEIPAGESIPWHRHPGPAIVAVAEGTFELVHENCQVSSYAKGQAFVDEGHVHSGRASRAGPVKVYVTYLIPEGAAPAAPVEGRTC